MNEDLSCSWAKLVEAPSRLPALCCATEQHPSVPAKQERISRCPVLVVSFKGQSAEVRHLTSGVWLEHGGELNPRAMR
jgi:hypothetical protein